jgi:hypothetical protein
MRALVNRRVTNKDVQYSNRLTQFTNPPIQTGDLFVINDLTVGGNCYLNNLEIRKNLKVYGDLLKKSTFLEILMSLVIPILKKSMFLQIMTVKTIFILWNYFCTSIFTRSNRKCLLCR